MRQVPPVERLGTVESDGTPSCGSDVRDRIPQQRLIKGLNIRLFGWLLWIASYTMVTADSDISCMMLMLA